MNYSDITKAKVKSFLQGYTRYYYDNIFGLPAYIKEQVYYRLFTCKDTCLVSGECEKCGCPTIQKSYATKSCNKEKFPDLMSYGEWTEYKKLHNIPVLKDIEKEIDDVVAMYNSRGGKDV